MQKAQNMASFVLHKSYEIGFIVILILPIRKLKLRVKSLGQDLLLSVKVGIQDQVGLISKYVLIPISYIVSPGL